MGDAIIVRNLGKRLRRYHPNRPTTLQEALLGGLRRMWPAARFWALREVSFSVALGRGVGLIGPNGAGKSTLLRLIGGVGRPDEGSVEVHGRIGALLELGAGLHPDLTGRENVYINGVLAGLSRREVAQQFDSIVAFAELEEFIDSPLHTYSTGMQMRLSFAVAAHTKPDILLIDEVLAVGDLSFQRRCLQRIEQFKAEGCAIILVSHDAAMVQQFCDEALWLRAGRLVAHGPAEVVVNQYVRGMTTGAELRINENRFGSLKLEITAVRLLDGQGVPTTELNSGDALSIEIDYMATQSIHAPIFSAIIVRLDGVVCFESSTVEALTLPTVYGQGRIVLHLDRLDLNGGLYYVDVGAYEREGKDTYDYHWHVYPLIIRSASPEYGILCPPHRWKMESVKLRGMHSSSTATGASSYRYLNQ
jgi:lipopolysaccharide transport system ATP-binding protein